MKELKINKKVFIAICVIVYIAVFLLTSNFFWYKGYDKGINEVYNQAKNEAYYNFKGGY